MRLVFRSVGVWLIGVAVVLVVLDGTRSLAADAIVVSSLESFWLSLDAGSLEAVRMFLATRFFAALLGSSFATLLGWPAFAVIGVPGVLFALLGRSRQRPRFVTQEIL